MLTYVCSIMCLYAMSYTGYEALFGEFAHNVGVSTLVSGASGQRRGVGVSLSEVVCLPEVVVCPGIDVAFIA